MVKELCVFSDFFAIRVMNMFAIGMQLKVLGGLLMFSIIVLFIPNIANYLVEKMNDVVMTVLGGL